MATSSDKLGLQSEFFIGVVEDRQDPAQLGRVRVRCIGYHTEIKCNDSGESLSASGGKGGGGNTYCIDTEQLPWAVLAYPVTAGAMNGIGESPSSLVEGTWVVGIFMDGKSAQVPMVLSAIAGIPECVNEGGDPEKLRDECDYLSIRSEGFYDPRSSEDLESAPRPPKRLVPYKSCEASETSTAIVSSLPENNTTTTNSSDLNSFGGHNDQSINPAQLASSDENLAAGMGEVGMCIEENDAAENYPLEGKNENAYRKGTFLLEPDTNRLARTEETDALEEEKVAKTHIQWKKDNIVKDIDTAEFPDISLKVPDKCEFKVGPGLPLFELSPNVVVSGPGKWEEPETLYNALYPYNHVKESESGHLEEIDDTPGAERLHRMHRSGTAEEIFPDGTRVTKIVGENYEIYYINNKLHVKANCDVTIDKAYKLYVNRDNQEGNNLDIHVGANSNFNLYAESDINLYAQENLSIIADKSLLFSVGEDVLWRIGGDVDMHIGGTLGTTVVGAEDHSVGSDYTELVQGTYLQEITETKTQHIGEEFYSISGGSTTIIGLPHIYLNPIGKPGSVIFEIDTSPSCA